MSTEAQPTKWRIPFEQNKAAYNEALKADPYDDMGSYIYGEREQWLIHSIETKNFVATFEYANRHDAYGVIDENGGRAAYNNSKKLIAINLYTRQGLMNDEAPIKTVHFEYDYSLCPDVPNNDEAAEDVGGVNINADKGKLTLKRIYFTYGESNRGKLHQYKFDYGYNPSYSLGNMDRWGNYNPALAGASCDPSGDLNNFEYPYANQDKGLADLYATAWSLKTVHLPSGSKIDIELEADDYSYVMEKEASKMFKVLGMSTTVDGTPTSNLVHKTIGGGIYMHVDLGEGLTDDLETSRAIFREEYIGDLEELYFKFQVSVSPEEIIGTSEEQFEYIAGYAPILLSELDVIDNGGDGIFDTGIIPLGPVGLYDEDFIAGGIGVNPIAKATWQFIRKYLPNQINPIVGSIYTGSDVTDPYGYGCAILPEALPDSDDSEPEPAGETMDLGVELRDIVNIGKSHVQNLLSLGGINAMMKLRKFGSKFNPNKSWVRLYQGVSNRKIGGGHRVKQITVNDNWADVKPTEASSEYGTKYQYNKLENRNTISSGVASYEPITAGGDENSYRKAQGYSVDVRFRVDDNEFQEKPYGESIFATSQVAYSKVEISNIDYAGIDQSGTGKTTYEFFTARDFPSIVKQTERTDLTMVESKSMWWLSALTGDSHNYLSMSDGYSIQMNDMHGKFKKKTVWGEGQTLPDGTPVPSEVIYGLEHKYYKEPGVPNKLRNNMNVVDESGAVSTKFIGKDIDMVLDLNESRSYHTTYNGQLGVDVSLPVVLPSFWFSESTQDNRFRSSVTTKVIYSNGILEEIILIDKSREKRTRNLLFDEKTGVPVVTEIIHEEGTIQQPIYQYDYPAYWMYEGMGLASENWGAVFENIADASAKITLAGYEAFLNPGDEIAVSEILADNAESFVGKFWIVEKETTGDYYLVDRYGDVAPIAGGTNYRYKVVRSGKRNLLGSTAASVTSLARNFFTGGEDGTDITITESPYSSTYAHSKILNASAVEYTEKAAGYLGTIGSNTNLCGILAGEKANPYVQGLRANWNLLSSYVLDVDRDQTLDEIRNDGTLSGYVAFWKNTAGKWGINPASEVGQKWIKAAIATIFDREGYNLESKDALGIYSSILLGYNKTLKIAEAVNARYNQIGFNGFEDYDYDLTSGEDCSTRHFEFTHGIVVNDPELAHSGRHSLRILSSTSAYNDSRIINDIDHTTTDHSIPYEIQLGELIGPHTYLIDETVDNRFVLSAWVKEEISDSEVLSFDHAKIELDFPDEADVTDIKETRSNIIDGWQRIEIEFTIPGVVVASELTGQIKLANTSIESGAHVYFDDVRIQPYNSEMVSYVIDPLSLRLWATLDSRNFATFYQYDEEGSLIRIIQETERGKVTVQENRAGIKIK